VTSDRLQFRLEIQLLKIWLPPADFKYACW
jgi:hypothetical protein